MPNLWSFQLPTTRHKNTTSIFGRATRKLKMDLLANENDPIDEASTSSGAEEEDVSDPSTMFDSEATTTDIVERDKRRKAFVEKEEKHVRNVRRLLAVSILACAVVVSTVVFSLSRTKEHHGFAIGVRC
jgi:hypothetical protein